MKLRLPMAALLLAGAVPLAWAQDQPAPPPEFGPRPPTAPTAADAADAAAADTSVDLAAAPLASSSSASADELGRAIVQELLADSSLQGSKITVASEDGVVTLTGVTPKKEQAKRASEIATARAGEGKVINAITTEEL